MRTRLITSHLTTNSLMMMMTVIMVLHIYTQSNILWHIIYFLVGVEISCFRRKIAQSDLAHAWTNPSHSCSKTRKSALRNIIGLANLLYGIRNIWRTSIYKEERAGSIFDRSPPGIGEHTDDAKALSSPYPYSGYAPDIGNAKKCICKSAISYFSADDLRAENFRFEIYSLWRDLQCNVRRNHCENSETICIILVGTIPYLVDTLKTSTVYCCCLLFNAVMNKKRIIFVCFGWTNRSDTSRCTF